MKILPIFNNYQRINNNINIKKENNTQTNPTFNTQITGIPKSYISFSGGDSLDLYKTFALLRGKYEIDGEEQEPFLVKQEILKTETIWDEKDNEFLDDLEKAPIDLPHDYYKKLDAEVEFLMSLTMRIL